MRRIIEVAFTASLAASLALSPALVAFADDTVADGDAATAGAQNVNVSIGEVCLGETADVVTPVHIVKKSEGRNVFKDGSSAAVTRSATAGVADVTVGSAIALPSNWGAAPNGTLAGPSRWTLRITPPTSVGAFSRSVTFTATGVNDGGDPVARTDSITYSGTAVSCVVAKKAQTITFEALSPRTFGDASFSVGATASSGLSVSFSAAGACSVTGSTVAVTSAGSCAITAGQEGNETHEAAAPVTRSFVVAKAPTVTSVSCPDAPYSFSGVAQTPCSASVSGAGGLEAPLTVTHTDNLHAGTATASSAYTESANHLGSVGSATFTIAKAVTVTTVTCGAGPFTYTGEPQTPCSAEVTGPADLERVLLVTYTNNVNVGTAGASASYASTGDYLGSEGSSSFGIGRATTATTVTCEGVLSYTGAAQTPCSARVTGPGLDRALTVAYADNVAAGLATASASFPAEGNYAGSSAEKTFTIAKAVTEVQVSCTAGPFSYTGAAQTPCSARVTGPGGLDETALVTYTDNINAGTATASAAYAGTGNYLADEGSTTFGIGKATSTTTVTCGPGPFVYSGSAFTPCTASVTGPGGLGQALEVVYSNNTNAGTATARATYAGADNYLDSSDAASFVVAKAPTVTSVSCPDAPYSFSGVAQTPCSASVSGAGGLEAPLTVTHTDNLHAGTATASSAYTESANHLGSVGSATFTIAKAVTVTTVTCGAGPFTYTGEPQTPCSAEVTGPADLERVLLVTYTNNVNVGTAGASASYASTGDYLGSEGSSSFGIGRATTATTVTCEGVLSYTGAAQTPCSARVTGPGLDRALTVAYADNVAAGLATASASFPAEGNYAGSSAEKTFTIAKAVTEVQVSCTAGPFSYTGAAQTPCSARVTGPGGLDETALVTYTDNINAGTATASAAYAGTGNYLADEGSTTFGIGKATSTTTVTCGPGPFVYSGSAFTPCTASVTGPGGLGQALEVVYSNNTNAGTATATATATYPGNGNYLGSTSGRTFTILSWTVKGFYSPVDMAGVLNTVKGGSTVPLKFEVFRGATELTSTGVVSTLAKQVTCSATAGTDDVELTATGGTSLRYDTSGGQFIFNWQTPKTVGGCYSVTATMQDGSAITALFKTK